MTDNEVGDRVHNFFAQDNLAQGQHHSQIIDGSWQVLGNNLWAGSQRHIVLPSSNSKNYNHQQSSEIGRGHSSHSFPVPHGLNLTHSTLRPDSGKSQSQGQQPNLNGYMHGRHIFQTRENEANLLGVGIESDCHNIASRGLSTHESQHGSDRENYSTSNRSESSGSPISFDFFGSQQQISGQQTGMLQSLPRQPSGFSEMQLLQQQAMLRKMQDQRQQQIQQLEAGQHNSINQIDCFAKHASVSHSPDLINSTPISPLTEASTYSWAAQPTAGNTNWQQRVSPIQGSSNGFRFPLEQGQALNLMGSVPQQVDQSLYGIPISNTRGGSHLYSHNSIDKPSMHQITQYNSFPGNQYTGFPDQVSMQDGSSIYRQGFEGENMFGHASVQGLNGGMNLESLQQVNAPFQEFHEKQELAGPSETLQEKTAMQVSSPQNVVALDPTEEKILFGDDNIWDAFANSANDEAGGLNLLNDTGSVNGFPSLQSGSWSALMQSAVAETPSNDIEVQEEWCGLNFQNTEVQAVKHLSSTYENNTKKETVLADDSLHIASTLSSGSVPFSDDTNINNSNQSIPGFLQPGRRYSYEHGGALQMDSTSRSIQQSSEEGSKWLSRGPLQKPPAERSQIYGNAAHSWSVSSPNSGQPHDKPNVRGVCESVSHSGDATMKIPISHVGHIRKADSGPNSTVGLEHVKSSMIGSHVNREDYSSNNLASIPNSSALRTSEDTSQLFPNSHQLNYWKKADSSNKSKGSESSGKSQNHLKKGSQVLESSMNSSNNDSGKVFELENCDRKENSSDSHQSIPPHTSTGGLRENIWSDGSDSHNFPGGKQKSSGQAGRKTLGPRKFQYHPMGNLDEDVEVSYGAKHSTHSQVMLQQIPQASYCHNQGNFEQSNFFAQFPKTSNKMEKGHSPDLQGNRKWEDEVPSQGTLPSFSHETSACVDRSDGTAAPNKARKSSQNMLELLHKVDQPKESDNFDGSVSQLQQNPSSASQGFGLQLAPPSQCLPVQSLPVQNRVLASQASLSLTSSEIRNKDHTWLASTAQVQSLPSSHKTSQRESKVNKIGISGQTDNEALQYGMLKNFSPTLTSGFPNSRSQPHNQQKFSSSGKLTTNQPISQSFGSHASHLQETDNSISRDLTGQSTPASLPDSSGITSLDNAVSFGDTPQPIGTNYSQEKVSSPQISVGLAVPSSQPFIASGISHQPIGTNYSQERVSSPQISVGLAVPSSQTFIAFGISHQDAFPKMVPNVWTNVPGQQQLGAQPHKFPPTIFQSSLSNNNSVSTLSAQQHQEKENQPGEKGGNDPCDVGTNSLQLQGFVCGDMQPAKESFCQMASSMNPDMTEKMIASEGKESVANNSPDACTSNCALTQRDIEAFARSLKPNNLLHQNYSLLYQMQAMKSAEIDPSNRGLKRLKEADSGLDCQIPPKAGQSGEHNAMVGDSLSRSAVPSADSKMLKFSGPMDHLERNTSSQLGNISQDTHTFGRKDIDSYSHSNDTASFKVEPSQISPQMAPSWFNQYGSFRNGQTLSMYDAQKTGTVKTSAQMYTLGNSSDSVRAHNSLEQVNAAVKSVQVDNTWQRSSSNSIAIEHFSSPQSLAMNVANQSLVAMRPKKRKSATSVLLPWHKEVMQGSRSLLTIRMAEVEWAKASNRLIDKMEDEAVVIYDRPPTLRPKRRLVLTTQLMQQLFFPPQLAVLSVDASSNYDTLAYLVARVVLGDACSLIPISGSNSLMLVDSTNLLSDKHKTSERADDQHLSKVMEDFIGRARQLEKDFMRLDKSASFVDLRIEFQDLEKFSVINRFAKFHGRGQADRSETSSFSSDPTPQKHVTALQVPRNLPDRVQCYSL